MKPNKLPLFLISVNPMVDPDTIYVLHTRHPRFIAKVIPTTPTELLHLQKSIPVKINGQDYFIGTQTTFNNQLFAIVVLDFYDTPEIDTDAVGTGVLMSRLGDWFYSYLKNKNMNSNQIINWLNEEINGIKRRNILNLSAFERACGIPPKMLRNVINGVVPVEYLQKHANNINDLINKMAHL